MVPEDQTRTPRVLILVDPCVDNHPLLLLLLELELLLLLLLLLSVCLELLVCHPLLLLEPPLGGGGGGILLKLGAAMDRA